MFLTRSHPFVGFLKEKKKKIIERIKPMLGEEADGESKNYIKVYDSVGLRAAAGVPIYVYIWLRMCAGIGGRYLWNIWNCCSQQLRAERAHRDRVEKSYRGLS